MKALCFFLFWCLTFGTAEAQDLANTEAKYASWIYLIDSKEALKGAIIETTDSAILFVPKSQLQKNRIVAPDAPQVLAVTSIEKIKLRRIKSQAKGAFIGAIGGAALGGLIAYANEPEPCPPNTLCFNNWAPGDRAVIGLMIGSVQGLILGSLAGSIKKTILLNGKQDLYVSSRADLSKYTVRLK